ncbi:MAG: helicase C-terminal domain-containing protein [Bacilli bacterium]
MDLFLSVHDIVDFVLRTGDLDNRIFNRSTMQTGTDMHQQYQQSINIPGYHREMSLQREYAFQDLRFIISGKADGLYELKDTVVIEEIKTTIADLKTFHQQHETWHMMQALFYGHMYASLHHLKKIQVKLIYLSQVNDDRYDQVYDFTMEEAQQDIQAVIDEYGQFYQTIIQQQHALKTSLPNLKFPFKTFRKGQRELAKYVYGVSQKGGRLFVEAPTGIGKTMSTLFPMIKGLFTHHEKVFYFTAKNSGKMAAVEALERLRSQGIPIRYVVITAKEKISFCPKGKINPDDCLYARGYYDKIKDVLLEGLSTYQAFTPDTIQSLAEKHKIEPFELSLDLSLYVDVVIADYNYLFDPNAYLRRFFEDVRYPYAVLIDEAHNLVERSRDMYSAMLQDSVFQKLEKATKKGSSIAFKNRVKRMSKQWNQLMKDCKDPRQIDVEAPFINQLDKFITEAQLEMRTKRKSLSDEAMDSYFKILRFYRLRELIGDHYRDWCAIENGERFLKFECLDASSYLQAITNRLHAVVFFSATLTPMDYFLPMLGASEQDPRISLASPFEKKQFKVVIASKVSTTLKTREKTYLEVALYIEKLIENKIGNYLIFFPSYPYLKAVQQHLQFKGDTKLLVQTKDMTLEAREDFLNQFTYQPQQTTVGLAVLGGVFSEGIDLVGDRLIGVGIVSVGLPQLSFARDLITNYHQSKGRDGFTFGYVYPAINKVLQAMGRVIRTETDRGVALLIDERFLREDYQAIQDRYPQYEVVHNPDELEDSLATFFSKD